MQCSESYTYVRIKEIIRIGSNAITNVGCKCIADTLKTNVTLQALFLSMNRNVIIGTNNIGESGCIYLGEALKVNKGLQELYIGKAESNKGRSEFDWGHRMQTHCRIT